MKYIYLGILNMQEKIHNTPPEKPSLWQFAGPFHHKLQLYIFARLTSDLPTLQMFLFFNSWVFYWFFGHLGAWLYVMINHKLCIYTVKMGLL